MKKVKSCTSVITLLPRLGLAILHYGHGWLKAKKLNPGNIESFSRL